MRQPATWIQIPDTSRVVKKAFFSKPPEMLEIWAYKEIDFVTFLYQSCPILLKASSVSSNSRMHGILSSASAFFLLPVLHSYIASYCWGYKKIVHSSLMSMPLEAVFNFAKEAVVVTDSSESSKIAGLVEYNSACYFNGIGNIVFG